MGEQSVGVASCIAMQMGVAASHDPHQVAVLSLQYIMLMQSDRWSQ